MATIAFNRDIAPLRSQFFPVGGLRQSEFAQLQAIDQQMQPQREQQMKLVNNMLNLQQQELAFERSQLALDSARRKSKMEVDAMGQLPALSNRLEEIYSDGSKDAFQKTKEIAQVKMGYATTLQFSPAMQDMFSSASSAVQADAASERQKQAEAKTITGSAFQIAQQGGDVESLLTDPDSQGGANITAGERAVQVLSDTAKKRSKDSLERDRIALERGQKEKQDAALKRDLIRAQDTLNKLDVVEQGDMFERLIAARERGEEIDFSNLPEPKDTSFDYTQESLQDLQELMLNLNPSLDEDFVRNADPEQLRRAALRTTFKKLKELSPVAPAPSPAASAIRSSFD